MTVLGHVAISALAFWGLAFLCLLGWYISHEENKIKWMFWYRRIGTWTFYIGTVILIVCGFFAIWGIR